MRCVGTSVEKTLNLYSHKTFPVAALKHNTRSISSLPLPKAFCTYTRSPFTTGAERPPNGAFQARFSPAKVHFSGKFCSSDLPSRMGPRQSGQSAAHPGAAPTKVSAKVETTNGTAAKRRWGLISKMTIVETLGWYTPYIF